MVLISEVKVQGNRVAGDLKKLAMCMKASIDRSRQLGCFNAAVCGLFIKGTTFKILMMGNNYDGGYRLLDLHTFHAPRTRNNGPHILEFYQGVLLLGHYVKEANRSLRSPGVWNGVQPSLYVEISKKRKKNYN